MSAAANRVWDHSFFFTPQERDRVSKTSTEYHPSITTNLLGKIWSTISAGLIPETVAPNSISLLGVVFALQGYQLIQHYYETNAGATTNIVILLLCLSVACSSLDGVHAKRCRSFSPVGQVFSKVCSAIRHVFLALTLCVVLGVDNSRVQWYIIMSIQLVQLSNLFYLIDDIEERRWLKKNGPAAAAMWFFRLTKRCSTLFNTTEASIMEIGLLLARQYFVPSRDVQTKVLDPLASMDEYVAMITFYIALGICVFTLLIMRTPKGITKWSIALCIAARACPVTVLPLWDASPLSLIADGAMLGLLSVEVRVSSIARRPIHSAVIAIILCSLGSSVTSLVAGTLYTIGMLADLCYSTNTPLFTPVRNVYIDGVYDLCHIGHKRLMENALRHGNRLLVGVLSDEECVSYKRKPVMTTEERCTEVASCKWVAEVIPDCPAHGITEEFIKKHNIHICVYGEEYDKPDDHYYAVPRRMGIGRIAPRTKGMSTSEIIRRIANSDPDALAAKDKLSGKSTVTE